MRPPVLSTPRLILRAPEEADFERWAALMSDPDASRWIGGPLPRSSAWRGMASIAGSWSLRGQGMFSVVERSGRWLGRVGPWMPEGWPGREIGWALHPDAQGQGYAIEATTAAIDWAVEVLGWPDFIHIIAPENRRSIVLAERLGSKAQGPTQMPEPYSDHVVECWGQTAAEWRARPHP